MKLSIFFQTMGLVNRGNLVPLYPELPLNCCQVPGREKNGGLNAPLYCVSPIRW